MNIWKIVGQISSGFGIIFMIFAAFEAFVSNQALSYQYNIMPPAGFVQAYVLNAMIPFLLFAVLSFVVAGVTMRAAKAMTEEETQLSTPEQQPEEPLENQA